MKIFSSWQNFTQENYPKEVRVFPLCGRGWIYLDKCYKKSFHIEWYLLKFNFGVSFKIKNSDDKITFYFAIPLISLCITFQGFFKVKENKEVGFSVHDWALWWNIWRDPMGDWNSKVPKWRYGSFHFLDFLLGKSKYQRYIIKERDILVPLPEANYQAKATLCKDVWKRPRWFPKCIKRIDISIPKGIPHPGKGENSWDCGDDATYGICCLADSIADGVGKLVGSVLEDRVKYGGYKEWNWEKPNPDPLVRFVEMGKGMKKEVRV